MIEIELSGGIRVRVEGSAGIGMRVEPAAPFSAEAAPLAQQEGAAEQIGPDFKAVEAELVAFGADADQRRRFREKRELDGADRAVLRRSGMESREVYQTAPHRTSGKRGSGGISGTA